MFPVVNAQPPSVFRSSMVVQPAIGTTMRIVCNVRTAQGKLIKFSLIHFWLTTSSTLLTPSGIGPTGGAFIDPGLSLIQTGSTKIIALTDLNGELGYFMDNTGGGSPYTRFAVLSLPDGVIVTPSFTVPNV